MGQHLSIFNFHRLLDSKGAKPHFDDTTYSSDELVFRASLIVMKKHADAVSQDDLLSHVTRGTPLPKSGFMITFDDGYRDNYDLAMPIMKELNVPGIFFIPTEAIEERKLGWWDIIFWYLKQTQKPTFKVRGQTYDSRKCRFALAENFIHMMKSGADAENATLLDELQAACEAPKPTAEMCDAELMTWDQIRECEKNGIAIGSHTHTHRVLAGLDLATQREEMLVSKRILEERLGHPVRSIAYPVGGYEHFNVETVALAKECGYDLAFSFQTGVNKVRSMDPHVIRRISFQTDPSIYGGVISMPWIFGQRRCALKAPLPNSHFMTKGRLL